MSFNNNSSITDFSNDYNKLTLEVIELLDPRTPTFIPSNKFFPLKVYTMRASFTFTPSTSEELILYTPFSDNFELVAARYAYINGYDPIFIDNYEFPLNLTQFSLGRITNAHFSLRYATRSSTNLVTFGGMGKAAAITHDAAPSTLNYGDLELASLNQSEVITFSAPNTISILGIPVVEPEFVGIGHYDYTGKPDGTSYTSMAFVDKTVNTSGGWVTEPASYTSSSDTNFPDRCKYLPNLHTVEILINTVTSSAMDDFTFNVHYHTATYNSLVGTPTSVTYSISLGSYVTSTDTSDMRVARACLRGADIVKVLGPVFATYSITTTSDSVLYNSPFLSTNTNDGFGKISFSFNDSDQLSGTARYAIVNTNYDASMTMSLHMVTQMELRPTNAYNMTLNPETPVRLSNSFPPTLAVRLLNRAMATYEYHISDVLTPHLAHLVDAIVTISSDPESFQASGVAKFLKKMRKPVSKIMKHTPIATSLMVNAGLMDQKEAQIINKGSNHIRKYIASGRWSKTHKKTQEAESKSDNIRTHPTSDTNSVVESVQKLIVQAPYLLNPSLMNEIDPISYVVGILNDGEKKGPSHKEMHAMNGNIESYRAMVNEWEHSLNLILSSYDRSMWPMYTDPNNILFRDTNLFIQNEDFEYDEHNPHFNTSNLISGKLKGTLQNVLIKAFTESFKTIYCSTEIFDNLNCLFLSHVTQERLADKWLFRTNYPTPMNRIYYEARSQLNFPNQSDWIFTSIFFTGFMLKDGTLREVHTFHNLLDEWVYEVMKTAYRAPFQYVFPSPSFMDRFAGRKQINASTGFSMAEQIEEFPYISKLPCSYGRMGSYDIYGDTKYFASYKLEEQGNPHPLDIINLTLKPIDSYRASGSTLPIITTFEVLVALLPTNWVKTQKQALLDFIDTGRRELLISTMLPSFMSRYKNMNLDNMQKAYLRGLIEALPAHEDFQVDSDSEYDDYASDETYNAAGKVSFNFDDLIDKEDYEEKENIPRYRKKVITEQKGKEPVSDDDQNDTDESEDSEEGEDIDASDIVIIKKENEEKKKEDKTPSIAFDEALILYKDAPLGLIKKKDKTSKFIPVVIVELDGKKAAVTATGYINPTVEYVYQKTSDRKFLQINDLTGFPSFQMDKIEFKKAEKSAIYSTPDEHLTAGKMGFEPITQYYYGGVFTESKYTSYMASYAVKQVALRKGVPFIAVSDRNVITPHIYATDFPIFSENLYNHYPQVGIHGIYIDVHLTSQIGFMTLVTEMLREKPFNFPIYFNTNLKIPVSGDSWILSGLLCMITRTNRIIFTGGKDVKLNQEDLQKKMNYCQNIKEAIIVLDVAEKDAHSLTYRFKDTIEHTRLPKGSSILRILLRVMAVVTEGIIEYAGNEELETEGFEVVTNENKKKKEDREIRKMATPEDELKMLLKRSGSERFSMPLVVNRYGTTLVENVLMDPVYASLAHNLTGEKSETIQYLILKGQEHMANESRRAAKTSLTVKEEDYITLIQGMYGFIKNFVREKRSEGKTDYVDLIQSHYRKEYREAVKGKKFKLLKKFYAVFKTDHKKLVKKGLNEDHLTLVLKATEAVGFIDKVFSEAYDEAKASVALSLREVEKKKSDIQEVDVDEAIARYKKSSTGSKTKTRSKSVSATSDREEVYNVSRIMELRSKKEALKPADTGKKRISTLRALAGEFNI